MSLNRQGLFDPSGYAGSQYDEYVWKVKEKYIYVKSTKKPGVNDR